MLNLFIYRDIIELMPEQSADNIRNNDTSGFWEKPRKGNRRTF